MKRREADASLLIPGIQMRSPSYRRLRRMGGKVSEKS
eukprot:CAMPEP_0204592218 /NCGR_PEP_ID=MMETSP0661-20131031/50810_1 /ASSEMBLY_ACC=CAM_ASM_000606 /TAXON_ID=109239 /ORGANISM="Alexandrium margalefi, Strain AMGDE01CS-322" /LENGTH=36 /DNA_ID= /DNA_START= /DNA_END= /DNA_ORIENTATION=